MTKPLGDFYDHPKAFDGRRGACKECEKAHRRATYNQAYHRRYREAHKDARPDSVGGLAVEDYMRAWRKTNPERVRMYGRVGRHRRRARHKAAEGFYRLGDLEALWLAQNGLCAYCGLALHAGFHVEHKVPLVRGGSNWPANLCLSCESCNRRKGSKTEVEFRALLAREDNAPR